MFESREYEYADITVYLGARDVTGLRSIKYKESQEKEALYGKGNKPRSIQKGNKSYEGEIGLLQSEVEALRLAAITQVGPRGTIVDLEATIVVTYGNPSRGDALVTNTLIGCQFTESEKGMAQGDKFMEITLPFVCLDII